MGRNGMGKTTTVRSIIGFTRATRGIIRFAGRPITHAPSHRIARAGIGLVPEGRQLFPNLTVEENLIATAAKHPDAAKGWSLARVYELFPKAAERRRQMASRLSGGEQQMVAIGRALMTNPRLLILDEATEGLAPLVREEIWRSIRRLKEDGMSILVIDKNVDALIELADRHYILEKGRIIWSGNSAAMRADAAICEPYLGVAYRGAQAPG
jgi:branched-chain amino acid transport system ATP-binding protein